MSYTPQELYRLQEYVRETCSLGQLSTPSLNPVTITQRKIIYEIEYFTEVKKIIITLEMTGRTLTIYYEGGNVREVEYLSVIFHGLNRLKPHIESEFLKLMSKYGL